MNYILCVSTIAWSFIWNPRHWESIAKSQHFGKWARTYWCQW